MKKNILKNLMFLSCLVPILALYLDYIFNPQYGFLFFLFMTSHAILRIWDTFFTSKEKDRLAISDDWTLILVTFVYIFLCYLYVTEFYVSGRTINVFVSAVGFLFYFLAFRLRWWGMAALGKQWAIHAIGEKKVAQTRLIQLGPFKYVRHPIYLSILVEQLGILLIANALYSMIFFLFITIPAYAVRMNEEEKSNVQKFGKSYIDYQHSVGMVFPKFRTVKKA